ncbi:hypothetical protein A2U01_0111542, partial [Trifolium medium]|nr:hypothetical protein [Trifolium medium]
MEGGQRRELHLAASPHHHQASCCDSDDWRRDITDLWRLKDLSLDVVLL